MLRNYAAVGLLLFLAGCETLGGAGPSPPPPPPPPAAATLSGHDGVQAATGARASCAGFSVAVMTDTPAMRQRMTALYGSPEWAIAKISAVKARSAKLPGGAPPEATAPCDGRGGFSVGGLEPGSYFLIARVTLTPPRAGDRDYVIMRHVFLRRGEAREVALIP
jgi:hypothetical protein